MSTINFIIHGEPKSKLRPRFTKVKGVVRTYSKQKEEETTLKWKIKAKYRDEPLEGPIHLSLIFVFKRPKSRKNDIYHQIKPDLDNIIKFLLDAGNETLWHDDKQIVSLNALKIYGENPQTVINMSKL